MCLHLVKACCLMASQFWMYQLPWGHLKQSSPVSPVSHSKLQLGQFSAPLDHLASSHTSRPLSLWQVDSLVLDVFCLSHLLFPALVEYRELHTPFKTLISSVSGQQDKIQLDSGYRILVAHCLPHYQQENPLWTVRFSELISTSKAIAPFCVHFILTAVLLLWLYSVLY